jgi:hypothetical protein
MSNRHMPHTERSYYVEVIRRDVYVGWITVRASSIAEARQKALRGGDDHLSEYEYQYTVSTRTGKVEVVEEADHA